MKKIEFAGRTMVIADRVMERNLELAARAAKSGMAVLISGPSGTGKELIARYIHERSERRAAPFVSVNCAAIPDGLIEAELFGYERGSFTGAVAGRIGKFERASSGTLLLDEVSEMPYHLQAKLLRVLQEGEIDRIGGEGPIPIRTRVVATTNIDPLDLIRKGEFRADLFYRLNVIRIDCAPLAGRKQAIECLAVRLLHCACEKLGVPLKNLSSEAIAKLVAYGWPGNVRELQNVVERAALVCDSVVVNAEHLDLRPLFPEIDSEPSDLASLEQHHIRRVLQQTSGNRTEAARRLGITQRTLRNKIKSFGTP